MEWVNLFEPYEAEVDGHKVWHTQWNRSQCRMVAVQVGQWDVYTSHFKPQFSWVDPAQNHETQSVEEPMTSPGATATVPTCTTDEFIILEGNSKFSAVKRL